MEQYILIWKISEFSDTDKGIIFTDVQDLKNENT